MRLAQRILGVGEKYPYEYEDTLKGFPSLRTIVGNGKRNCGVYHDSRSIESCRCLFVFKLFAIVS